MKKIIYYIFLSLLVFSISSCSDVLDVDSKSSLDDKTVFSEYGFAEMNIFSIYEVFAVTNGHRGRFLPWYGINTDIEWYNNSGEPTDPLDGKRDLGVYDMLSTNSSMNAISNPYSELYSGVERTNIAIDGLRKYGNTEKRTDMRYLLGEVLTLRALFYCDLIKAWGDVPARFSPLDESNEFIHKSDRDVIYKQIIADLQEAEDYVYWPNEGVQTKKTDRINKAYVKGLLARVCLMAGGYAQRPDAVGAGSAGSSIRLSNDPDLERAKLYAIALKACEEVIAGPGSELEPDFKTIWIDNMNRDLTAGKEVIFSIPFSNTRGRWLTQFGIRHMEANQYVSKSFGGSTGPTPSMFYDYDKEDSRRDITCVNYRWKKQNANDALAIQEPSGIGTWYFGKYRFEWVPNSKSISDDDGVKPIYMRYADILLMAAECANELNGYAAAKPHLKKIRQRAFPNNIAKADAYVDAISSDDDMFKAIVDERALEFCGEFLRKADLIRWNLLKTKIDETKVKMSAIINLSAPYNDLNSTLYYKTDQTDKVTLITYGLEHGEVGTKPAPEWTSVEYITTGKFKQAKIDGIYRKNPDQWQYWPIFQVIIDSNNGYIVNDYGY